MADLTLMVRRTIRAPAARVFAAWTTPEQLLKWWGPAQVVCVSAEVDLRVGGAFRLANQLPDGNVLWISGEFEHVEAPHKLVYSWRLDDAKPERVTVHFKALDGATEVIVLHERIATPAARTGHEAGWVGCLDGLAELFAR